MSGNGFTTQLTSILNDYELHTEEELRSIMNEIAAESVSRLQATSPVRTGAYAGHWTSKKAQKGSQIDRTIYVEAPDYRLTHLLEHGHASRNGGRVAAKPHIKAVETTAINDLIERLKSKL